MRLSKHYTSIISNSFGKFASKQFTPKVQKFINDSYVRLMGLDMSEFDDTSSYKSLNALFTRALKVPRELPQNPKAIIAGVDARITDFGKIEQNKAYQIKGMSYDISELLGEYHQDAIELLEGGEYVNYYLSPKDYHRYHAPMNLKILSATHIPGKLYPVNFPLLRNMQNLFIENERVIIECQDDSGNLHIMVLVGALNVGKMIVSFEPNIQTNSDTTTPQHYEYDNVYLKRGEEFGYFMMGSTILTFSQKDSTMHQIALNQKSHFGQLVGYLK
jgi:phosphatidylserine decarboxylase